MTQTTPLAGAAGMPGGRIARHLLDRPDARLRSLVRGGAAAGKRAALCPPRDGVRRILSSDFALALFEAAPGEHVMFDLRREADEKTAAAAA